MTNENTQETITEQENTTATATEQETKKKNFGFDAIMYISDDGESFDVMVTPNKDAYEFLLFCKSKDEELTNIQNSYSIMDEKRHKIKSVFYDYFQKNEELFLPKMFIDKKILVKFQSSDYAKRFINGFQNINKAMAIYNANQKPTIFKIEFTEE